MSSEGIRITSLNVSQKNIAKDHIGLLPEGEDGHVLIVKLVEHALFGSLTAYFKQFDGFSADIKNEYDASDPTARYDRLLTNKLTAPLAHAQVKGLKFQSSDTFLTQDVLLSFYACSGVYAPKQHCQLSVLYNSYITQSAAEPSITSYHTSDYYPITESTLKLLSSVNSPKTLEESMHKIIDNLLNDLAFALEPCFTISSSPFTDALISMNSFLEPGLFAISKSAATPSDFYNVLYRKLSSVGPFTLPISGPIKTSKFIRVGASTTETNRSQITAPPIDNLFVSLVGPDIISDLFSMLLNTTNRRPVITLLNAYIPNAPQHFSDAVFQDQHIDKIFPAWSIPIVTLLKSFKPSEIPDLAGVKNWFSTMNSLASSIVQVALHSTAIKSCVLFEGSLIMTGSAPANSLLTKNTIPHVIIDALLASTKDEEHFSFSHIPASQTSSERLTLNIYMSPATKPVGSETFYRLPLTTSALPDAFTRYAKAIVTPANVTNTAKKLLQQDFSLKPAKAQQPVQPSQSATQPPPQGTGQPPNAPVPPKVNKYAKIAHLVTEMVTTNSASIAAPAPVTQPAPVKKIAKTAVIASSTFNTTPVSIVVSSGQSTSSLPTQSTPAPSTSAPQSAQLQSPPSPKLSPTPVPAPNLPSPQLSSSSSSSTTPQNTTPPSPTHSPAPAPQGGGFAAATSFLKGIVTSLSPQNTAPSPQPTPSIQVTPQIQQPTTLSTSVTPQSTTTTTPQASSAPTSTSVSFDPSILTTSSGVGALQSINAAIAGLYTVITSQTPPGIVPLSPDQLNMLSSTMTDQVKTILSSENVKAITASLASAVPAIDNQAVPPPPINSGATPLSVASLEIPLHVNIVKLLDEMRILNADLSLVINQRDNLQADNIRLLEQCDDLRQQNEILRITSTNVVNEVKFSSVAIPLTRLLPTTQIPMSYSAPSINHVGRGTIL